MTPLQREILRDLDRHGDNVPGNLAENVGCHPKSVPRILNRLEDLGFVENKGRGVWTLTEPGEEVAGEL